MLHGDRLQGTQISSVWMIMGKLKSEKIREEILREISFTVYHVICIEIFVTWCCHNNPKPTSWWTTLLWIWKLLQTRSKLSNGMLHTHFQPRSTKELYKRHGGCPRLVSPIHDLTRYKTILPFVAELCCWIMAKKCLAKHNEQSRDFDFWLDIIESSHHFYSDAFV